MAKRDKSYFEQSVYQMGLNVAAWEQLARDQRDTLLAAFCMHVTLNPHVDVDGAAVLDQSIVDVATKLNGAIGRYLAAGDDETAQALLLRVWGYQANLSPDAQARFRMVFDQPPVQHLRQRTAQRAADDGAAAARPRARRQPA